MRRAAKIDKNQPDIVKAYRQIPGCAVKSMAGVGSGFPDLLVYYQGHYYLVEVKDKGGKLTPDQVTFHRSWPGKIHIVYTVKQALAVIGI